jgi:hypothetical protein
MVQCIDCNHVSDKCDSHGGCEACGSMALDFGYTPLPKNVRVIERIPSQSQAILEQIRTFRKFFETRRQHCA